MSDNRCNCVKYARQFCPSLPYGLFTLWQKKRIVNSNIPLVGEIAVHNYNHVSVVVAVSGNRITIREANYKPCQISMRTGSAGTLGIYGYYRPSYVAIPPNSTAPVNPALTFPRYVVVKVPVLNVRRQPNTKSAVVRQFKLNSVLGTNALVGGQTINGINEWLRLQTTDPQYVWRGGINI